MKLSVVIPSYKFAKYIEQSVYSVLFQKTDFEFEVLVRDDFSQDGTDQILERISYRNSNLKIFKSEENWGGYENIKFFKCCNFLKYVFYFLFFSTVFCWVSPIVLRCAPFFDLLTQE